MTRVVTKEELGRPVERLREQMEKLQLHSSWGLSRPKGKAGMLERQLAMAEERMRRLDGEKQAAETRAEQAERAVSSQVAFLFTLTFIPDLITQSSIVFFCTDC